AANPTADDFRSYADLGRVLPKADPARLVAVSMFLTLDQARRAQARFGLPPEIVALDLGREPDITYALTNESTGDISVWAPSSEVLLACVIGPAFGGDARSYPREE